MKRSTFKRILLWFIAYLLLFSLSINGMFILDYFDIPLPEILEPSIPSGIGEFQF